MPTLGRLGQQLTSRLWKASVDEEVDAELAFHVEMRTRELVGRGMSREDAHRVAVDRFGDLAAVGNVCRTIGKQREREMRRTEYLHEFAQDIRFAIRQLVRTPVFTIVAVLTLALGLGATTAIFSAVNAVLLRSFGYARPERVVLLMQTWKDRDARVSAADFTEWEQQTKSFEHVAAVSSRSVNVAGGDSPERVLGASVTAGFFPTFGVAPELGRVFQADEDKPGNDQVVVLSHDFWQLKLGGDTHVVGHTIQLNERSYTVLGVMPPHFNPVATNEQLWIPAAFTAERRTIRDEQYLLVVGVLKPGVSIQQAQRELEAVRRHQREAHPDKYEGKGVHVSSLTEAVIGDFRLLLLVLLGAVTCVLLIACGNVANLLLARGAARAKEFGIRSAIGAGHGRLVRQMLTESFVLALAAAVIGVALAAVLVKVLIAAVPANAIPRLEETRLDSTVLAFALAMATMSSLAFGLVPALRVARTSLEGVIKEGGRSAGGATHDRVRSVLIAAEVGVALTLLFGAGLLIRSASYLQRVPLGFDGHGVLTARVALPQQRGTRDNAGPSDAAQTEQTFRLLLERLRENPRVRSVALASNVPLDGGGSSNGLVPEGKEMNAANGIQSMLRLVSTGYFETMGIRVKRGRTFSDDDRAGGPLLTVVSQSLADRAWPGQDPIGKRITWGGGPEGTTWKTVIGVVNDVRASGPAAAAGPEFYLLTTQAPPVVWDWVNRAMTVVVRPKGTDVTALADDIREAVRSVNPQLPVYSVATMDERLARVLAQYRFNSMLLTTLGIVGLLLAAAGIYSVISYFVTLRTQEIGVRMALGATGGNVLRLLTWQGMRPVLAGVATALIVAFWGARLLRGSPMEVAATDPLTFATVSAVLIAVALAAIVIPARRATSVNPMVALNTSA